MLYDYVVATNDTSILQRALPLAEVRSPWYFGMQYLIEPQGRIVVVDQ